MAANRDQESKMPGHVVVAKAGSRLDYGVPLLQAVTELPKVPGIQTVVKQILADMGLTCNMSDLMARLRTHYGQDVSYMSSIIESAVIELTHAHLEFLGHRDVKKVG